MEAKSSGAAEDSVQTQLKILTQAVRAISGKLEALSPSVGGSIVTSPRSPSRLSHHGNSAQSSSDPIHLQPSALTRVLSTSSDIGNATDDEQELLKSLRPHIYPHTPRARRDQIEVIIDGNDDKIKLEGLEGIFNLAGLLLGFAFFYLVIRNLSQYGLRFTADTFLCSGAARDAVLSLVALFPAVLLTCFVFLTEYAFVHGRIGASAMVALYVLLNAMHLVVPCIVAYTTQIAPLAMALVLLAVLVLMLKNHSYVATNFAMRMERMALEVEEAAAGAVSKGKGQREGEGEGKGVDQELDHQQTQEHGLGKSTKDWAGLARGLRRRRAAAAQASGSDGDEPGKKEEEDNNGDAGAIHEIQDAHSESKSDVHLAPRNILRAAVHAATLHTSLQRLQGGSSRDQKRVLLAFPNNVRFSQFAYFVFAPTLVYEPLYPRSKGPIRWLYIVRKLLEGGLCFVGQVFLMGQFIEPVLSKLGSAGPLTIAMAFGKLAIPVFLTWLMGFYQLFHVHLNVVAELMRFADREFFGQWWSATTLQMFWRRWNRPVSELCLRHFYIELTHFTSASKEAAMVATFSVSAILHEVIFSVAFKTLRPYFFLGMLGQIPLIVMSRGMKGTKRGNLLMWLHLFFGFPALMILYSIDWYSKNDVFFCVPMREGWDEGLGDKGGLEGAVEWGLAYLAS